MCRTGDPEGWFKSYLHYWITIYLKSCCFFGLFDHLHLAEGVLRAGEGRGRVWLRKIYLCFHSLKPAHSKNVPSTMRSAAVWLFSLPPSLPQPDAKACQLQEFFIILQEGCDHRLQQSSGWGLDWECWFWSIFSMPGNGLSLVLFLGFLFLA